MPRKLKMGGEPEAPPSVEEEPTRAKGKAVFRSPSRGLRVLVDQSVRTDQGGGNYTLSPPQIVEFQDRIQFGEAVVDQETAEKLRAKLKERKDRGLPPRFAEV